MRCCFALISVWPSQTLSYSDYKNAILFFSILFSFAIGSFGQDKPEEITAGVQEQQAGRCGRPIKDRDPAKLDVPPGIVMGKPIKLVKPKYPKAARKQKISGQVSVHLLIDVDGIVVCAEAIDGPPELHDVSETAGLKTRYTPTTLWGQPIKVSSIITYNFVR